MAIDDGGFSGQDWSTGTLEARARLASTLLNEKFGEILSDVAQLYLDISKQNVEGMLTVSALELIDTFSARYGKIYSQENLRRAYRIIHAYIKDDRVAAGPRLQECGPVRNVLELALAGEKHDYRGIPNPPANENTE